jgi:ribosomal protein S18 acetylase RimI-like enzyme
MNISNPPSRRESLRRDSKAKILVCAALANGSAHALPWHTQVLESLHGQQAGCFQATDNRGVPVLVQWGVADITSPALAVFKREICEFASGLTAQTEGAFARVHPEAVAQEHFLAACAPLFAHGVEKVDWQVVQETIKRTVREFYLMDIAQFGEAVLKPLRDDLWFFATIRSVAPARPACPPSLDKLGMSGDACPPVSFDFAQDERLPSFPCTGERRREPVEGNERDGEMLGFVQFAVTPALAQGEVKLMQVLVAPDARQRGLERLLLGLIWKLIPGTTRVFTGVRPTNTVAIAVYEDVGFVRDANAGQDKNHPINPEYWTVLVYTTERNCLLQNIILERIES